MFNKLKNYLLTNQPLLWNTRFITAGVSAIIINIIFIFIGHTAYRGLHELQGYNLYNGEESFILPSVLVSVLFFIVWLFFYTKNNAFKNLYPLRKGYLVKEFLLIFIIIALNCSYIFSYRFGYATHAMQSVKDMEIVTMLNRANRAMMFLPMENSDYEIGNSCDSLNKFNRNQGQYNEYEESIANETLVKKAVDSYHEINGVSAIEKRTQDSLWKVFTTNFEDSIRKADHMHEKDRIYLEYDKFHPRPNAEYEGFVPVEEVDTAYNEHEVNTPYKERAKKYSYYFYCQQKFYLENFELKSMDALYPMLDSNESVSKKGIALLKAKDAQAIKKLLNNFKADLSKAKVHFNFSTERYVKQALNDSLWRNPENRTLENHSGYSDRYYDDEGFDRNNFMAFSDYNYFLENTTKLQYNLSKQIGDAMSFLALIFTALALAFAIFLFRLNGIKEFLLSIVAGGVLSLAIGLFMYLAKMVSGTEALVTFGTIGAVLTILGIFAVKVKFVKLRASIFLNIGAFSLALIWMVVFGTFYEIFKTRTIYYAYGSIKDAFSIEKYSPFYEWLRTEHVTILWIYVALILLSVFLYLIPLSKKLRANPEE